MESQVFILNWPTQNISWKLFKFGTKLGQIAKGGWGVQEAYKGSTIENVAASIWAYWEFIDFQAYHKEKSLNIFSTNPGKSHKGKLPNAKRWHFGHFVIICVCWLDHWMTIIARILLIKVNQEFLIAQEGEGVDFLVIRNLPTFPISYPR